LSRLTRRSGANKHYEEDHADRGIGLVRVGLLYLLHHSMIGYRPMVAGHR